MTHIGERPSRDIYASGLDIECQCARCGSSVETERCNSCEDGFDGHDCGEDCCPCLYPEDNIPCDYCRGKGVFHTCQSSPEWCEANPMHGRENIPRGTIEWYTVMEPTS